MHEPVQLAETPAGDSRGGSSSPQPLSQRLISSIISRIGTKQRLRSGQLPDLVAGSGHRLRRGKHVQIATVATEAVAVVPEREAQEVQALRPVGSASPSRVFSRLIVSRNRPSSSPFDPVDQPAGLIARQDDEVIRVPHQLGLGPGRRDRRHGRTPSRTSAGRGSPAAAKSLRPCGVPCLGRVAVVFALLVGLDDGTFQPHADQRQHRAVGDPSLQTLHQLIVRNRVEVRLQIRVVHLPIARRRGAGGSRRSPDGRSGPDETRTSCPGSPPRRSARAPATPPFARSGL